MSVPRLTQIGLQVVFQRLGLWSTGGDIGARGYRCLAVMTLT
jgi:hypothetical protein